MHAMKCRRFHNVAQAFSDGLLEICISVQLRRRILLIPSLLLAFALAAPEAMAVEMAPGCPTTGAAAGASQLLNLLSYISEALLGIGAVTFLLMVSIGALFIIFGGTGRRVYKGQEMIKQSIVGLAILAGGLLLKYVILGIAFSQNPSETSLPSTCAPQIVSSPPGG